MSELTIKASTIQEIQEYLVKQPFINVYKIMGLLQQEIAENAKKQKIKEEGDRAMIQG